MNYLIKLYYQLRGYSSFWRDSKTGRWYAYDPEHMKVYWSHEAERVPVPMWGNYWFRMTFPFVVWRKTRKGKLYQAIAWRLPKELVLWAYTRVVAHATTGEYGDTVVPDITAMEALDRWVRYCAKRKDK